MGQCRYVHLFHGLNSASIPCDLNQKLTHTSVPWSEQSTLDFCVMWLEYDTDTCVIALWYTVRPWLDSPWRCGTIMSLATLAQCSTSLSGIYYNVMMQYIHTHLFLGVNNQLLTSVSSDLNPILISELNVILIILCFNAVLNTEIDTGDCHGFECCPRPWLLGQTGTRPCTFHSILFYLYLSQIWIWTLERIVDTYLQDRINGQWI